MDAYSVFILIIFYHFEQSTISIKNSNFFEAYLDNITIEVNWEDFVVANPDVRQTVKVPSRSSLNVCYVMLMYVLLLTRHIVLI